MIGRDSVAIVTGAAGGIGRAVCTALRSRGCHIVLVDYNEQAGTAAADEIGGLFIRADLSRQDECRRLVNATLQEFGHVDILINNAGFQHVDAVENFPENIWEKMISVMLTAPFLLTKYVWPSMKARGRGRIVNVSSIHGKVASPFKAGYISAKHGLIGLTRTTALEGGPYGITVNAICPAYVRTPLVEDQIKDQAQARGIDADEVLEKVMLEPAAIRRLIEPAEIGELVAYLCSDSAAAVTGSDWAIDLGWTAR